MRSSDEPSFLIKAGGDLRCNFFHRPPNHIAAKPDLQQFLYRVTPRRLPEDARYRLTAFLGIDQIQLADALFAKTPSTGDTLITGASPNRPRQFAVPFLDLSASAGAVQKLTLPVKQHLIRTINGSFRVTGLLGLEADSHQVCG